MITHRFLSYHMVYLVISLFVLLIFAPTRYCQEDDDYYSDCVKPFHCGHAMNLSYPFWAEGVRSKLCGLEGFNLRCKVGPSPVIAIENQDFLVKSVNQSQNEMTIAPLELWENPCPATYNSITLDNNLFSYTPDLNSNISLFYNCSNLSDSVSSAQRLRCSEHDAFYGYDGLRGGWMQETTKCNITITVPVQKMFLRDMGLGALREGFSIRYKYSESCDICRGSGGICGTNITNPNPVFTCLCPDHHYPVSCPAGSGDTYINLSVLLGSMASVGILIVVSVFVCFFVRRIRHRLLAPRKNQDVEAFLEKNGPLAIKRYTYSQVKKMTNSFREKLGQGGYGSVYKGAVSEGGLVAVKMLNVTDEEGEGFLNEVAAISRTSHVNIVSLLGFCLNGRKRALVYEFMPNGSLDKFISLKSDEHLGWGTFHRIAIGIAQGLEYLHRGCKTRIVHFDIKPHNVLLNENLTPKISDFGLAKLCTRKESKVSMLEARGTIGYIAPEVMYRHFGQVSSKSDVYSYGMMILEIVGERNREVRQTEGNNSSNMYFPNWIYKSLELENKDDISEEEDEIVRKLKMVGLWCIQTNPSDRPTMSEVIEMLQGNIQNLNIPPKPYLSSSPQFSLYSSTSSTV